MIDKDPAPRMKTRTYRLNFVGHDAERFGNDGGLTPLVQNLTLEEFIDDRCEAGGEIISVRFFAGFDEIIVREPQ